MVTDDDDDDDEAISGSRRQFADIMFGARLTKTVEMDIAMVLVEGILIIIEYDRVLKCR